MGYKGPNEIYEDVPERSLTVLSMFYVSDSEYQPVTRGMLYNLAILNSLVTGHLGKMIINTNSDETCGVGSGTCEVTLV